MNQELFGGSGPVDALEKDLTAPSGPRISTMRNHNFAIVVYAPAKEFQIRQRVRGMIGRLEEKGWAVHDLALHTMLFARLRRELGEDGVADLIKSEKTVHAKSPERAIAQLRRRLTPHIDGVNGLAKDIEQSIVTFRQTHQTDPDRTLVLLGRIGALYPFFRSSALLKYLGGRTENVPVVLLYPGELREGGLSFMQMLEPDRDYRPRVYA